MIMKKLVINNLNQHENALLITHAKLLELLTFFIDKICHVF